MSLSGLSAPHACHACLWCLASGGRSGGSEGRAAYDVWDVAARSQAASEPNIAGQCHGFSMLNKPGLRI